MSKFKPLRLRRRERVRKIAAKIYLMAKERGNSREWCNERARAVCRREFGFWETLLIQLAIKLAIELIKHWWKNQSNPDPEGLFVAGEPGERT